MFTCVLQFKLNSKSLQTCFFVQEFSGLNRFIFGFYQTSITMPGHDHSIVPKLRPGDLELGTPSSCGIAQSKMKDFPLGNMLSSKYNLLFPLGIEYIIVYCFYTLGLFFTNGFFHSIGLFKNMRT